MCVCVCACAGSGQQDLALTRQNQRFSETAFLKGKRFEESCTIGTQTYVKLLSVLLSRDVFDRSLSAVFNQSIRL